MYLAVKRLNATHGLIIRQHPGLVRQQVMTSTIGTYMNMRHAPKCCYFNKARVFSAPPLLCANATCGASATKSVEASPNVLCCKNGESQRSHLRNTCGSYPGKSAESHSSGRSRSCSNNRYRFFDPGWFDLANRAFRPRLVLLHGPL